MTRPASSFPFSLIRALPLLAAFTLDPLLAESLVKLSGPNLYAPSGLNNSGTVVGFGGNPARALIFSPDSPPVDIGTLGGTFSSASDINDAGGIVGSSATSGDAFSRGFLYSGGAFTELGTLGGGYSAAIKVNELNHVVGESATKGSFDDIHAFFYSSSSGMVDLGTLGGKTSYSQGINDNDVVVGHSYLAGDAAYHAFLYSVGTGMIDLAAAVDLGMWSMATGINDSGQITGSFTSNSFSTHAFLYEQGNVVTDLGTLGGAVSVGRSINAYGQVVGESLITGNAYNHAFLYDDGSMQDLNERYGFLLSDGSHNGFTELFSANGINDLGKITGVGTYFDSVEGYSSRVYLLDTRSEPRAVPDSAGTLASLSLTCAILFLARRRFVR